VRSEAGAKIHCQGRGWGPLASSWWEPSPLFSFPRFGFLNSPGTFLLDRRAHLDLFFPFVGRSAFPDFDYLNSPGTFLLDRMAHLYLFSPFVERSSFPGFDSLNSPGTFLLDRRAHLDLFSPFVGWLIQTFAIHLWGGCPNRGWGPVASS
jgi:hypothetical protein